MFRPLILIWVLSSLSTSALALDPDFDLDGLLSAEEAARAQGMMFEELDQNDDDRLSVLETVASLLEFGEKPDVGVIRESMALADGDRDGLVSAREFVDYGRRRFDVHDSNDDGYLSLDEALRDVGVQHVWPIGSHRSDASVPRTGQVSASV